ncbi:hypothetical protein J7E99_03585 [Streptomyces sp. ISL-44]|uniref:hypothetical protein n=1 Tax=Streptomyces sp. ISL-44 TaxID=2819184 RepID=UPI001BE5A002|nr:hypothetical protein [Streptomyces sp. ISL-44]MBT2539810.1 hypothetical protein [Streptomyces sp. ISL-44]
MSRIRRFLEGSVAFLVITVCEDGGQQLELVLLAQRPSEMCVHPAPGRAGARHISILCQEGMICHCSSGARL